MARILVADDEPDILSVLASICELDSHEIRTEETIDGAVEAFVDFAPELMILDLNMSHQGGGPQILAKLDRLGGTGSCAVIIMSGRVDEEAAGLSADPRVKAVLQKPFVIDLLRKTVADALA